MPSLPYVPLMAASIIAAFIGLGSYFLDVSPPATTMTLTPPEARGSIGAPIVVAVVVRSDTPVNAFAGTVTFNPDILSVQSIDYNTSIADLWAEEPWYKNGDGTLGFAGGSTRTGGFTGEGTLLTITFTAKTPGKTALAVRDAQILQHDGLGTETTVNTPIDTLFTIDAAVAPTTAALPASSVIVRDNSLPSPDLNSDGRQSLADVSILMQYLLTGDPRGDLNGDGAVSLADLSLILTAE